MLGGAGVVEYSGYIRLFAQEVPQRPVVDARRLAGDSDYAQTVLITPVSRPGDEALEAVGVVGSSF